MPSDPQVLADDLCELLHRRETGSKEQELASLLLTDAAVVDDALQQVSQRGLLGQLLCEKHMSEDGVLLSALLRSIQSPESRFLLCDELCRRQDRVAQASVERVILSSGRKLTALFALLIDRGDYESLRTLLSKGTSGDTPALRALASVRPTYGMAQLNQPTLDRLLKEPASAAPFDMMIVPGYTPLDVDRPTHLREIPAAMSRVALAASEMEEERARCILVSGGSVHPAGTPYNEALMMREQLLKLGVASDQILVDPHARHSTTNLRNAGRVMLSLGMRRGLVISGFDRATFSQGFYFGHPVLSTFLLRCQEELGYSVGQLDSIDEHHIALIPSEEVTSPNYSDPLDV